MKTVCMAHTYNEEKIIAEWVEGVLPLVDEVCVVDNHSTDRTLDILAKYAPRVLVKPSIIRHTDDNSNEGLSMAETLHFARSRYPDWILWLDADEIFEDEAEEQFPQLLANQDATGFAFRIYPFWKSRTHYRVDGDWGRFPCRHFLKLFRNQPNLGWGTAKVHAGTVRNLRGKIILQPLRIKHFTVLDDEDAERKYNRYKRIDPKRDYSHIISDEGAVYEKWHENT